MTRGPRIAPGPFCPSDVSGLIPNCRLGRLRPFLDWARRQLQYRSPLPRGDVSDKNDCTVREFESVVMLVWLVEANLAKATDGIFFKDRNQIGLRRFVIWGDDL